MRKLVVARITGALALWVLTLAYTQAQIPLEPVGSRSAAHGTTRYYYLFENDRFTTPLIEVGIDGQGKGRYRFRRKDGEEIANDLSISGSLVAQIQALFDEVHFLETNENYQFKKDFSHLGKVTLKLTQNGRERAASFNYTSNQAINRLVDVFRNIATQENRVFEIATVRETDPISTPAQLRLLETELRSKQIAEPQSLSRLLQEIRIDESVPLIARNHAERLLKMIGKVK